MNDDATQAATAVIARIMEAMMDAQESVMREQEEFIKGMIDTPYPPSSDKGSPPHMRTGALYGGIQHETMIDGTDIKSTMVSARNPQKPDDTTDVPAYLDAPDNSGMNKLDRPFMSTSFNEMSVNGLNMLRNAMVARMEGL